MRRLLGIALTLLIALSWAPAAVCAARCGMVGSPADMNMADMVMPTAAISSVHSCCPGSSSAMVREAVPRPAWPAGLVTAAAFTPPAQAGAVLVSAPYNSALPSIFLLLTSAISPPLPLRI